MRTREEQDKLNKTHPERSRTRNSKHLIGMAIDIAPYLDGTYRFDRVDLFYGIADIMATASNDLDVTIRWGGCWDLALNKAPSSGGSQSLHEAYRKRREAAGLDTFVDLPHYELVL